MDFVIVTAAGEAVATVQVTADDIAEARALHLYGGCTDAEIAQDIYEHRYESVLAKAGFTYEDAIARGFTLRAMA